MIPHLTIKELKQAKATGRLITFHPSYAFFREEENRTAKVINIEEGCFGTFFITISINLTGNSVIDSSTDSVIKYEIAPDGKGQRTRSPLFRWAEENICEDDRCKKCGSAGRVNGLSCVCPQCHEVIWGI